MTLNATRPISSLIVDDERLARDFVKHMIEPHHDIVVVGECSNAADALEIISEQQPDLVFLDIKMPGMDGIQLAECLGEGNTPIIVFITAYDQFAIQAFERNAIDYLMKPFDQQRFDDMIDRARRRLRLNDDAEFGRKLRAFLTDNDNSQDGSGSGIGSSGLDRIVIKERGRVFFVSSEEVDYFEASGNYVALHIQGRNHLVYDSLISMESKLDPRRFLRIHRSTIVNVEQIKELQPYSNGEFIVILKSGQKLKLSRSYRNNAKRLLGFE